ncbi:uncharacterized protein LOC144158171 isoform X2 [Haemaphysalis longicornis]
MSSIKRRARTPGGPPYYASSVFTTPVSSSDFPSRSRPTLHQSSLDFTRGRNPGLSRRFRDGSWGSTECLVRPSTSALSSTANYVLSSLGQDYHRCRSPARTPGLPTRRFGRESSPSPMSNYYKSTYVSTWYDEYKPIVRERPAILETQRPARGSKERRESMGIITRHRHVVKFREDPSFHESSPVVSRARQDSQGHSTRSVDSGIGSFKESAQSPVDLDDILRLESPPGVVEDIKRDDFAPSMEINDVSSPVTDDVDDNRRRRRARNRDASEERQNATSNVPQEPATFARLGQRVRNKNDSFVPQTPPDKPVTDQEKTRTIELPKVGEIYETVVVKLKKGKGKGALGDVSAISGQVESVVHSLPTPNGHCDPAMDNSLGPRSREISPAVITLELLPKKDDLSKQPTQDNKTPPPTTASQPPSAKKGQKANKIFPSLSHLKTGKKADQDQAIVKKEVKSEPASPEVLSSQPPTPEPRKKHKLFAKTPQVQQKSRDEEEIKPKIQAARPQAAKSPMDTTPRPSKLDAPSKPEVQPEATTSATSPHPSDKAPSLPPAPQQKSSNDTSATVKAAMQDSLQTAPKESLDSSTQRPKTTPQPAVARKNDNTDVTTATQKPALGMLEFRKKEPLGRLEFKCKEPQGRLELKKARPIPLGAPPKAVPPAKPEEAEAAKSAQEPPSTPEISANKDPTAAPLVKDTAPPTAPKADVPPLPEKKRPPAKPEKPQSLALKPLVTALPPQAGSPESKVNKLLKKVRGSRDSESDNSVPASPSRSTAPSQPASPQVETPTALVAGTPQSPLTPDSPSTQPPTKTARKVNKVKKASKIKVPGVSSSGSGSSSSTGGTGDVQRAKKVSKERASPRAKDSSKAPPGSPTVDATPTPTLPAPQVNGVATEPSRTAGVDPAPVYPEPKPQDDGAATETSCECKVNCHKKCEKHMANLCGVNQKLLSEVLATVKKEMATSPPGSTTPGGKQARTTSEDAAPHTTPTSAATHPSSPRRSSTIADLAEVKRDAERAQQQWEQDHRQEEGKGEQQDSRPPLPESRSAPQTPTQEERVRFRKYNLTDFHLLKVLGKGSFGKVLLAELKGTRRHYAVKCLKKDVVLEDDDVECTLIERRVLALGTQHPFLCNLFCTFQSQSHLFFVMEFLNGGDLMFHIQQSGRFDQDRARFYAAEIVCALKFLHKKGIVYRDLKLDNLCIDCEGHVRIIDFGMCKLKVYRSQPRAFCGTPEYMAPEIIKGQHYNQSVDWWSFGILTYEMLIGQSPFNGTDEDELFWSVCNEEAYYPRFLSREAKSLLVLLLDKNAETRLGMPGCSAGDVCDQPFFRPIQWDKLERKEVEPPFKPKLKSLADVSNFDSDFTMEKPVLTPIDPQILASMDQEQFKGFTYTNPAMTD